MTDSKLSVGQLKSLLKENGIVQSGDKGTLLHRYQMFKKFNDMKMDGQNPCTLSMANLKKLVSKFGLSPIATQDEMLGDLLTYMEKNTNKATPSMSSSSSNQIAVDNTASSKVDPIRVAEAVLELDEIDDFEGILNLGVSDPNNRITRHSSVATMRKAYLKLSLLIHPDKIGQTYNQATKAFQALVKAFECLSSPDLTNEIVSSDKGKKSQKTQTIARSNEGCYRTRILCPRCRQRWSEGTLDGNPEYYYNFMMQGLKSFTCSTCLFHFGCVTAIHLCPHCQKRFEYSPADYHRKVECGNLKCKKSFGFFMFPASDRVMNEFRKELKEEQEARIRAKETKLRRASRSRKRADNMTEKDYEKAFMLGLIDCCPRCGEEFEGYPDEESQRAHLMECNDDDKIKKHKRKKVEAAKKEEMKQAQLAKQEAIEMESAFTFLGADDSMLWILDDDQIRNRALDLNLNADGSKKEIIQRIVQRNDKSINPLQLDDAPSRSTMKRQRLSSDQTHDVVSKPRNDSVVVSKMPPILREDTLPSNLASMSVMQLLSVCASHGILMYIPPNSSKTEILDIIDDMRTHQR